MSSLLQLPESILCEITEYLPQQALINLALTNYKFYKPCLAKLYRRLTIQCDPILGDSHVAESGSQRRSVTDFLNCNQTIIYGLNHSFEKGTIYSVDIQIKLLQVRLAVLNQSLEINPELVSYIKQIRITNGTDHTTNLKFRSNKEILQNLRRLISNLRGHQMDLFYIEDFELRNALRVNEARIRLRSITVDDFSQLQSLELDSNSKPDVSQSSDDPTKVDSVILFADEIGHATKWNLQWLKSLKELLLPSCEQSYWKIMKPLLKVNSHFTRLEKFKLVFFSDPQSLQWNQLLSQQIPWETLRELEILVGSPTELESDDHVIDCINTIPIKRLNNLRKISIVQSTEYNTHRKNELYDICIIDFVGQILSHQNESPKLSYICITHNLPELANFPDGVEGNFLRREQIYSELLPKTLNNSGRKIDLVLRNLFQTLACYEQSMNTVMWNGCKCSHCQDYLGKVDEFLLYHKYYNKGMEAWRDINCSLMLFTIGKYMSERMRSLHTHLDHTEEPLIYRVWNFHDTGFGVPFRCYDVEVVDQGEFDENNDEFFDSNASLVPCKFTQAFARGIPKSISHFLNDSVLKMINLNRGNAEEVVLGEVFKDGGDDEVKLSIRRLMINGISYNLGKELNGTNFFQIVYDV